MKRHSIFVSALVLAFTALSFAQDNPPPVSTSLLTLPIYGVNAVPVPGASLTVVGTPGQGTYCYWAVANYEVGSSVSFLGCVSNGPNTLSSGNHINIAPFAYPPGITGVDILQNTNTVQPGGACNCAVTTGLTSGSVNQTSNTLSSYTVPNFNPQTYALTLANEVIGSNSSHLILRQGVYPGTEVADLSENGSGFAAGEDLSGSASAQQVIGILSHALPSLATGFLNWNGSAWAFSSAGGTGTVTSVGSGTGLSGGPITVSGNLNIAASYRLPQTCSNGQTALYDSGTGNWDNCGSAGTGTVTSVGSGTGLSGGPITTSGNLSVTIPNNSATQGYGSSGNGSAMVSSHFNGYDTTETSGTDRCAAIKSAWTAHALTDPINAIGEVANESGQGVLTCQSNPFPVTASYGGTDAEDGGEFLLPIGAFGLKAAVQVAANHVNIRGRDIGFSTGSQAGGSAFEVQTPFVSGAGTAYCPFAFVMGGCPGYMGTESPLPGPFGVKVWDILVDGQGTAGVGGIFYGAGQENSGFDHFDVHDVRGASIMVGAGSTFVVDGGRINEFLVRHANQNTVEKNTTPANISAWTVTHVSGSQSILTITWNNSPTATPACGQTVVIAGAANGGTHSTNINGTFVVAALSDSSNDVNLCNAQAASVTFSSGATQAAFMFNSTVADSSSTVQGTASFYSSGLVINAIGQNRFSASGTLVANVTDYNAGFYPWCEADVSGQAIELDDIHAEEAHNGICVGLEQASNNITLRLDSPQTNILNAGVELFANWGEVKNFNWEGGSYTFSTTNPPTDSLIDDFNGNTLTTANNPVPSYHTGQAGAVGDVWAILADCAEMTNGWCKDYGKTNCYFSGGVCTYGSDSNGLIHAGDGLIVPSGQTLTLSGITGTQCLHAVSGVVTGTGADCGSGGSGTPGGSTDAVQFNAGSGNFGGITPNTSTSMEVVTQTGTGSAALAPVLTPTSGGGTSVLTATVTSPAQTQTFAVNSSGVVVNQYGGVNVDAQTTDYNFTCPTDRLGEIEFNISAAHNFDLPQAGSTSCTGSSMAMVVSNTGSSTADLTVCSGTGTGGTCTAGSSTFQPSGVNSVILNPGASMFIYSDATTSTGNYHYIPIASAFGGVNEQTTNYTATLLDKDKMIVMNCTATCALTLPATPPSTKWNIWAVSIGSTLATVSLNGLDFNGGTSAPPIDSYMPIMIRTDGLNYFGDAPLQAGANVTVTPTTNKVTVSLNSTITGNLTFSGSNAYGTPASITLTNATGYPAASLGTGNLPSGVDNSSSLPLTGTVASGTATLGTSAISSGACATVVTVSATGVATTDAITWTPNASIKAVTGYAPSTSGGLSIAAYPTSGNVNFDVCNWSASSITPGSVTLNWRVVR